MARLQVLIALMFLALVFVEFVASELVEDEDASLKELKGPEDDKSAAKRHSKLRKCRRQSNCGPGYICKRYFWYGRCYPQNPCSAHKHCRTDKYCDTDHVCKPGKRSCRYDRHCNSYYLYCKNKICERKECLQHYQCPSGKICQKPGVCVNYRQTCKNHRHCKVSGYICVNESCKKRQCYKSTQCPRGYRCVSPGLCKLRQGYCLDNSNCGSNQCCLKQWSRKVGMCNYHQRLNHWCDPKENYSCPCVQGYTCRKSWGVWGRCVSAPTTSPPQPTTVEPTEEPGSGSGDFEV